MLDGAVPASLNGSLHRNSPGIMKRADKTVGHWFDGDGAILGVHLRGGAATGASQFVRTKKFIEEEKAGKFVYPGFGYTAPGSFLKKFMNYNLESTANTSVLCFGEHLYALNEGGHPYQLDRETLETIGSTDLGWLQKNESYSAHPTVDYESGEVYNHGQTMGK